MILEPTLASWVKGSGQGDGWAILLPFRSKLLCVCGGGGQDWGGGEGETDQALAAPYNLICHLSEKGEFSLKDGSPM